MQEDPFERHEKEMKRSLVMALHLQENIMGYMPDMNLVFHDAAELYGSP